jgi:O-antigen/teichoic acid export membrane protein
MSSVARRVGRDTVLYGIGTIVARLASVALLPVYTRYLTPADYGLLQLLELAAEVTSILFVAGSRAGMMRFFYRTQDEKERNTVVSTTFFLETFLAIIATLALVAAAHPVWRLMLAGEGSAALVRLAALNFLLATLQNTPFTYLQTAQRAAAYTVTLIVKLVLQIAFNLYFLVYLDMGVIGMLWAAIVANAIVALGTVTWMLSQTGVRVSWPIVRDLRRFGVPYQLTSAGGFILTFGDRFFLQRYQGAAQVGLYALAYQFGFLLHQLAVGPFLRAWLPERHKGKSQPSGVDDSETRQGFLIFNLMLLSMATAIALGSRLAIRLLTEESYHSAAAIVPLVIVAYVLQAWVEAVKFGIDVAERTIYYTYASAAATVVAVAGYAFLIPRFGAMGAAVATIVAFSVRFALTLKWAHRLTPVDYGWGRIRQMVLIAAVSVGVSVAVAPASIWLEALLEAGLGVAYAVAVWRLVLHSDERRTIQQMAIARLHRFRSVPTAG